MPDLVSTTKLLRGGGEGGYSPPSGDASACGDFLSAEWTGNKTFYESIPYDGERQI